MRRPRAAPVCDKLLIRRSWHNVLENNLKNGACPKCGLNIPGVWQRSSSNRSKLSGEGNVSERFGHLNL